jgi:Protein of unknown function DUF262
MAREPNIVGQNRPAKELDAKIDIERNNLRTDKIDLTYGELASMYEARELIISPEYQRLFRWSEDQKASFVESLLLGFPIPAIFVAESDDGVWELVDGLQRISSVFEFMGVLKDPEGADVPPSQLGFASKENHRLPLLDGFRFEDLSLRSRLTLKRAYCRVEVIKVGSAPLMKYDVFERLNTGGSRLEPQEIRNAILRAINPELVEFFDELSRFPPFSDHLQLSEGQQQQMYDRGLVLRFFTLKNNSENFDHDVEPFITSYMKKVVSSQIEFNREVESSVFERTFQAITNALGDDAWRHLRDGQPKGGFSVYVYDALSVGVARNIDLVAQLPANELAVRCNRLKNAAGFRNNVGAGANTRAKMRERFAAANSIIGRND